MHPSLVSDIDGRSLHYKNMPFLYVLKPPKQETAEERRVRLARALQEQLAKLMANRLNEEKERKAFLDIFLERMESERKKKARR